MTTVYIAWNAEGVPLYVGCTDDIDRRMAQHATKRWAREMALLTQQHFETRDEALAVEARLITMLAPKANVLHNRSYEQPDEWYVPTKRQRKEAALAALRAERAA